MLKPVRGYKEDYRMAIDVIILIVVCVVLFLYLLYALLQPEKF
jgi:K+-transporting ATPase KdpF subunit